jgi:hypothetical protein
LSPNSKPITRREALQVGAAAVAVSTMGPGLSTSVGAAGAALRLRKNIENLSATELSAYVHAIKITKDRSASNPEDPKGYLFWAAYHDNFDASHHTGCAHYSEKFFPWHRRYLADFEKLLQATDPPTTSDVMIPYWDWSRPPTAGKHFPKAFEDPNSPLFDARLGITPPPWNPDDLRQLIQEHDWNIFAGKPDPSDGFGTNPGSIESGPHNTLHSNISRDMRNPTTAVRDAIFWSFHAGIDLVWARWQRLYVSDQHPQPFADPGALIKFRELSFTVASTAKTADLAYDYDYDFSADKAGAPMAIAEAATAPKILSPAANVIPLSSIGTGEGRITTQSLAPRVFAANSVFRIGGIKVFHDRSYRLNLYLHPKDVEVRSLADSARAVYAVRTVTLWQAFKETKVEIFVRPTASQLSQLNQGWVLTILSEALPDENTPSDREMQITPAAAPLPEVTKLIESVQVEER